MTVLIGKTRSWLWWLAGFLCAWVFGPGAEAGEIARPGDNLPPDARQPAVKNAEQQKQAEKLVADYLAPVAAAEPTADQKVAIEKLIQDLGSADFNVREAASAGIVKQGPAALALLREAAKNSDAEVATRAGAAVVAIEAAARQGFVGELKKIQGAAVNVIQKQLGDARMAQAKAQKAAEEARPAGKQEELARLQAEVKSAGVTSAVLSALFRQVVPLPVGGGAKLGTIAPLYGVKTPPIEIMPPVPVE